ncbi:MAG: DUF6470 family protein [Oscillospiraceae bacterium]|jgi:hypothetical protein|nr:DUF6470 family protein [Oscillospiraceae bacterium]
MSLLKLNIDQQLAQIGVRTTSARLNISLPRKNISIKSERPKMSIDKKAPTFKVNRQKINNESGLKSTGELAKTFRNKGRQAALQAAATAKNDGNFLANPKLPADKAIPQLAKNKTMARLGTKEYNIGLMPQSSPEVTWDKGHMRINWSKHSVVIDFSGDYMPDMSVDPKHSVEVFLREQPYFRVMVEEMIPNAGRYIDHAI